MLASIDNDKYEDIYIFCGLHFSTIKKSTLTARHHVREELLKVLDRWIIYQKDKTSGNGEYNQSLSSNSVLIEIGGVENSLEESYLTVEVLAKVIQDIWLEDNSGWLEQQEVSS